MLEGPVLQLLHGQAEDYTYCSKPGWLDRYRLHTASQSTSRNSYLWGLWSWYWALSYISPPFSLLICAVVCCAYPFLRATTSHETPRGLESLTLKPLRLYYGLNACTVWTVWVCRILSWVLGARDAFLQVLDARFKLNQFPCKPHVISVSSTLGCIMARQRSLFAGLETLGDSPAARNDSTWSCLADSAS